MSKYKGNSDQKFEEREKMLPVEHPNVLCLQWATVRKSEGKSEKNEWARGESIRVQERRERRQ